MKSFFNGVYLNTLNRKYNELDLDHYDSPNVVLEFTSFTQLDRVSPARNGVSDVVQLTTQTMGVDSLYWHKSRRGRTSLYVDVNTRGRHDFGSQDRQVLLIYKDAKGRKEYKEIEDTWEAKDFKFDLYNTKLPDKALGCSWQVKRRYAQFLNSRIRDLVRSEFRDLRNGKCSEELKALLSYVGLTFVKAVPFTHRFDMWGVQYVKNKGLNVEIGQLHVSTYNSLPSVLKITVRKSPVKFIELHTLGVEKPGYYSHHDRMKIRPEHVLQVQKFHRKFKSAQRGGS